jgi:large subunit ribosomal protein L35
MTERSKLSSFEKCRSDTCIHVTERPRGPRKRDERDEGGERSSMESGSLRWGRARGYVLPMPKMKTNRSAAKRFSFTGTGKVRRSKAGLNHMMQEKSRKRLRRLRKNDTVDKAMAKRVKIMLPYG